MNKHDLALEDILNSDDYINDLIINPNSKYKIILTLDNILQLIKYCFKINQIPIEPSENILKYAYYSSQILCSQNVLIFNKSIENIKKLKNSENTIIAEKKENKEKVDNFQLINIYEDNNEKEEINVFKETIQKSKQYFQVINKSNIEYDEEGKSIIYKILNEIFSILNEDIYNGNKLCYFQKIINFLLFHESNIIINYLFKDTPPLINKLYQYLDNDFIKNILENILNILSDKEDNDKVNLTNSKYAKIIHDLFKELNEDAQFQKVDYICN